MSNYPDNFRGTPYDKEREPTPESQAAEAALHWIHTMSPRIRLILIEGAMTHHLKVTKDKLNEAMAHIEDALADLFAEDRECLIEAL